jgi:hypothetical protein
MPQVPHRRDALDNLRLDLALYEVFHGGSLIRRESNPAVREDVAISGEVLKLGGGSQARHCRGARTRRGLGCGPDCPAIPRQASHVAPANGAWRPDECAN